MRPPVLPRHRWNEPHPFIILSLAWLLGFVCGVLAVLEV
jgi:hypothetical protein